MTGTRRASPSVEIDGLLDGPLPATVEEPFGRLTIVVSARVAHVDLRRGRSSAPSRLSALLVNATTGLPPDDGDRRVERVVVRDRAVRAVGAVDELRRAADQVAHVDVQRLAGRLPARGWSRCSANATKRPFALIEGSEELAVRRRRPPGPSARLTRIVDPSVRSRTKTLLKRSSSASDRPSASETNAT